MLRSHAATFITKSTQIKDTFQLTALILHECIHIKK